MADRIKLDMHTHTQFSRDSRTSREACARRAAEAGLGAVCVTDHDTAAGGLRLAALDPPFRVIPGEEVTTRDGELIGLYLRRDVPPRLPADETAERIRDQGGLSSFLIPYAVIDIDTFTRVRSIPFARQSPSTGSRGSTGPRSGDVAIRGPFRFA